MSLPVAGSGTNAPFLPRAWFRTQVSGWGWVDSITPTLLMSVEDWRVMAATIVGPAALNFASSQLDSDNGESSCIPASGNPAERTGRNVWYPSTGLADALSRAPLTGPGDDRPPK